jgi:transposase InsO family protein
MPFEEKSIMQARQEFVNLAGQDGANVRELCRRFGISPTTGYKWLDRHAEDGLAGLRERSRRPAHSPYRTTATVERRILNLRDRHPAWGARKLRVRLQVLGEVDLPSPATIQAILLRNGRIEPAQSQARQAYQRFEHALPNSLWQMDFKGHFALQSGRCHPLTVLDDHSRYSLCLQGLANEQGVSVQARLSQVFRIYGLPARMTMDNGSPWGDSLDSPYTPLTVWLLRLGIQVSHSRPYHPQTQGKDERFHRTLKQELLSRRTFIDLGDTQAAFDRWRVIYNTERPHEALGMQTPLSRYRPSPRAFPEILPPIEYDTTDDVRRVQDKGFIQFKGQRFRLSKAFRGYPVALRPTDQEGHLQVFFCQQPIAHIDQHTGLTTKPKPRHHVP